jgi:hypothetical protein
MAETEEEQFQRWTELMVAEAMAEKEEGKAKLSRELYLLSIPRRGFVELLDSAISGMRAKILVEYRPWERKFIPIRGTINDLRPFVITNTTHLLDRAPGERRKIPFWTEALCFAGGVGMVYGLVADKPALAALGGGLVGVRLGLAFGD